MFLVLIVCFHYCGCFSNYLIYQSHVLIYLIKNINRCIQRVRKKNIKYLFISANCILYIYSSQKLNAITYVIAISFMDNLYNHHFQIFGIKKTKIIKKILPIIYIHSYSIFTNAFVEVWWISCFRVWICRSMSFKSDFLHL